MKTVLEALGLNKLILSAPVLFIVFSPTAYSRKITFKLFDSCTCSEGIVKFKKDKNKNYNIGLSVIRLADPKRLAGDT
jgi:hypothetical protein